MLPRVKLYFENGQLGTSEILDDGVVGMVLTGVAVEDHLVLETPYLINSLDSLADLGITDEAADANAYAYKQIKEFFDEAPVGTYLYLMFVANTVLLEDMADKTQEYAKLLIEYANGKINLMVFGKTDPAIYEPTIVDALEDDVWAAAANAQALADFAAVEKYAPLMCILPGRHYTGVPANLKDLSEGALNRVCILIADTVSESKDACVGLLAGRISAIPVQRSIARVRTGAIMANALYIGAVAAELGSPEVVHDAGYICPRTFVGKTGYFWSDDKLATAPTDDYALIPRRRVIDKAYRIAYSVLLEELSEEIPVTAEGKISASIVKSIQSKVERAIVNGMTANGNLGNDPSDQNDTGVECFIDANQNIVSTSRLSIQIRVKPFGYAKYLDIYLGFKTVSA